MSAIDAGAAAPETPWRDEMRAMLQLSWPMVLTNLGQTAMTATDVLMMGRLGPDALAAGSLGANLYFMPLIFALGLMTAASPMIATELGRKRHSVRDVRRTVRQGLWLAIMVSIPIWFLLWQAEAILNAMGQEPRLAAMAGTYVRTLMWASMPFYGYLVLRSFISALERPRWALIIVFSAVAFNVLANWCLMYGNLGFPALGLPGSGIATTLSSALMFAGMAAVVVFERRFRRYRLFGRFWRADWPRLKSFLRLGMPIAALLLFEVSIFNAASFLMGLINAASIAAYAIAIQLASLSFMIPLGLGQAATVRVGRAYGAGDGPGVTRAGWTAYAMGVGFMAAAAAVMILFPYTLISAFIDLDAPENAEVVRLAATFLAFAGLFQIVDGAQAVAGGMLRGLHDTTVPMVYALIGYWGVGLPLGVALAFPGGLEGNGIWIGLSAGLAVVAALLLGRWLRRERLGLTAT
ncbi:MATE family efflux transporter [Mesorhizobium sp. KR9-304]|uniref:MATE family efflux transporter n=1 Tax=Mesorhizobium sp. KR9-304 TaxID=3156614 RepID=UPI0032B34696